MGYTVYVVLLAVISSLPPSTFGSNDDDVTTTTPYPYPVAPGTTPDYLGTFLDSLNDLYSDDDPSADDSSDDESSDDESSDDDSPTEAPSTGDFPNTTGPGFYPTSAAYYMDEYVDDYYYQYYDDAFVKMEESEGSTALFIEAWQNWVDDGGEMFSGTWDVMAQEYERLKKSNISAASLKDVEDTTGIKETLLNAVKKELRSERYERKELMNYRDKAVRLLERYLDQELGSKDKRVGDIFAASSRTINKRVIDAREKSRWDKGIVPYKFSSVMTSSGKREVKRAQMEFQRMTCIRFIPWVDQSTNTKAGITKGHLNFITDGGCFSFRGKQAKDAGQAISCCDGSVCIHELGHAMGLSHEQQSPHADRELMIRTNKENIVKWSAYKPYEGNTDSVKAIVGYNLGTFMHYPPNKLMNDKGGDTFNYLFPESRVGGSHYLMMEVSLAHKCEQLHCSQSKLKCDNDGYLTLVDGKCACKCVPGLDPDSGCRSVYTSKTSTLPFPGGSYALPEPKTGCINDAVTGARVHSTGGGNKVSSMFDLKGKVTAQTVEHRFCVTQNSKSKGTWPSGNYCIYRKGGSCPENFNTAFVQFDDKSVTAPTGTLPDGVFGSDTRLEYCCRDDGFIWEPISLPNNLPFVLIASPGDKGCQHVQGMHVYKQHYDVMNSNTNGKTIASVGGVDQFGNKNIPVKAMSQLLYRTEFCHYKPAMIDCGAMIELTKGRPSVTFSSPTRAEMDCTWFIKAPEGGHVHLSFSKFKIASRTDGSWYGDNQSCEDHMEIRYQKPGTSGVKICGDKMDETFQSVHRTLSVRLNTYGITKSSFTATVKLQLDADLCFNAADKGASYTGNVDVTRFFEKCLPWAEVAHCKYNPFNVPNAGGSNNTMLEGNFCRNPDPDTGMMPWCYTKADGCERNYCDACQLGNVFDDDNNCDKYKALGLCSKKELREFATSRCAKTCGTTRPKLNIAAKASSVRCGTPPSDVPDGSVVKGGGSKNYPVGSKVTYKCSSSAATRERVCLTSGEWSPMGFVCDVCPHGWHFQQSTGQCLKFFANKKTAARAEADCKTLGGTLATPADKETNLVIQNLISSDAWVPISDSVVEKSWTWPDGSSVTWLNWDRGQPSKDVNNEDDCAVMRPNGKWDDVKCSSANGYVCASPKLSIPQCLDFWPTCSTLFASRPNMCTENSEFAVRMCPLTCGKCGQSGGKKCVVKAAMANVKASVSVGTPISRGDLVSYSCVPGYVVKSGNSVRGCTATGVLTGRPLECIKDCPAGWTYSTSSGTCLSHFKENVSFREASKRCSEIKAKLAMAKNDKVHKDLLKVINAPKDASTWLGLSKSTSTSGGNSFVWSDGETLLGWVNWDTSGEVNEPGNDKKEGCISMRVKGAWTNENCDTVSRHYVCETSPAAATALKDKCTADAAPTNAIKTTVAGTVARGQSVQYSCKPGLVAAAGDLSRRCMALGQLSGTPPVCTKSCPTGWTFLQASKMCYKFISTKTTYAKAVKQCASLKGLLAMPKTKEESAKILSLTNSGKVEVWIGLSDVVAEGVFVWADKKPLDGWTNWKTKANSYKSKGCVSMQTTWLDGKCSKSAPSVCQTPLTSLRS